MGIQNTLLAPPESESAKICKAKDIPFRAVSARNHLDFPGARKMATEIRKCSPRIVHLHTGRATWIGGWAARWAQVPALTTRRMDKDLRPTLRAKFMNRKLVPDQVAVSPAVLSQIRKAGALDDRTDVIWDAVAAPKPQASSMRSETLAPLGIDPYDYVIATVGSLVHRKGVDLLIHATSLLPGAGHLRHGLGHRRWPRAPNPRANGTRDGRRPAHTIPRLATQPLGPNPKRRCGGPTPQAGRLRRRRPRSHGRRGMRGGHRSRRPWPSHRIRRHRIAGPPRPTLRPGGSPDAPPQVSQPTQGIWRTPPNHSPRTNSAPSGKPRATPTSIKRSPAENSLRLSRPARKPSPWAHQAGHS